MPAKRTKQPEPVGRIVTFSHAFGGAPWSAPPTTADNDFDEFYRLYCEVPVVRRAIDIKVNHLMAAGFTLEPEAEEWSDGVGLNARLREVGYGLEIYGNWLIEFTAQPAPYTDLEGKFPGIIGIPPQNVEPHGVGNKILYWSHRLNFGDDKHYRPDENLVHIHTDILDGGKWGPGAIRSAYANLEMKLAFENQQFNIHGQFAHPITVFMIPKDAKNPPSQAQMDQLLRDFDDMTEEEIRAMTINKNIEIQIIGSDRNIPDFMPLLEWNDTQVYIAMGVPPVMLERGQNATEATAKVQMANFNRDTEARQHTIEDFFNRKILVHVKGEPKLTFNPPVEPQFNQPATNEGDKQDGGRGEQPGEQQRFSPPRQIGAAPRA